MRQLCKPQLRAMGWLVAVVVAYALPYGLDSYAIHVANVAIIFAILAIGEGIALGVAGQINLAQVAFFGLSAYTVAMLTVKAGWSFWPAAVVAMVVAVVAGAVVGIPALRVQSHYLGIVTLGLALGFTSWITNAEVAGSANGISNIPVPPLFGIDLSDEYLFFYVCVVVGLIVFAIAQLFVRGHHGRRFRAMRDDNLAAASLGSNIAVLRTASFVISSAYAGVAGVLYAGLIRFVSPESFSVSSMFLVLAMVIIGGRQSMVGCVVGAVGLLVVRELLSDQPTYAQLGYGAVVVLVVVFAPTGLAGVPRDLAGWLRSRRPRTSSDTQTLGRYVASSTTGVGQASTLLVEGVSISFRGLRALDDVTLDVPAGQIRGVVGPNGSGKTTLFNIISGLYRQSSGTVLLDGEPTAGLKPGRLNQRGLARTFQNLRLFPSMTVRENIAVGADRSGTSSLWKFAVLPVGEWRRERAIARDVEQLLQRFGLTDFAESHPGNLAYGIQRRIEICRAMACKPRLLLLDEPAAGLNGEEVGQLRDMVRAIRDDGVTVLIVEHNMSLVMSLCDRVTVLSGGHMIADGEPEVVVTDPEVITAYLGGSTGGIEAAVHDEVERASLDDLPPGPATTSDDNRRPVAQTVEQR